MAKEPVKKETTKTNKNASKKTVKKVEKKQTPKAPKESYLKSVRKEMKLVKWPTWSDVIKNTVATVVLCILISAFFILLTFLLSLVKGWITL